MAFVTRAANHYNLPETQVSDVVTGMDQLLYNHPAGKTQSRSERRRLSRLLRSLRWRAFMQV